MAKGWQMIGSSDPIPYNHKEKARKDFFNLMKIKRMPVNKPKHKNKDEENEE